MDNTKKLNVLALLLIVLMLVCFGVLQMAVSRLAGIPSGPGAIAVSADYVAVDMGADLYLFNHQGGLEKILAYSALGVPDTSAKLQWYEGTLYLASAQTGSLYRCDIAAENCEVVPGFDGVARRVFGFVITGEYVVIADTARHQLKVYSHQGQLLAEGRGEPVPVCYPNQLIDSEQGLLLADTNNHRIARASFGSLSLRLDEVARTGVSDPAIWERVLQARSLPSWCQPFSSALVGRLGDSYWERSLDYNEKYLVEALDGVRPGRVWPTALVSDGNRLWVVAAGSDLNGGDVLIFHEGKFFKRVNFENHFDPVAIARMGETILVSDQYSISIRRFNRHGDDLGRFGSRSVNEGFHVLYETREFFEAISEYCQWAVYFLGALMLGVFLASRLMQRT